MIFKQEAFIDFFMYCIQHLRGRSDSTVSEDAGIEPKTMAILALSVRRSNRSARPHQLITVIFVFVSFLLPLLHTVHTSYCTYM
jgi:hypothetical protein